MAHKSSEDKKLDFSSLPRGAIGIKGLPVSRNTRLPSIRMPRDLTLGAPPKRTFMPNIPVRREKKSTVSENASQVKQESKMKSEKMVVSQANDRGRGRGRGRNIVQTSSSIFSDGIAVDAISKKEKMREAYKKNEFSPSPREIAIKKEDKDITKVSRKMDQLLRDDFIDDGDDDDIVVLKPVIFPLAVPKVKEAKSEVSEPDETFDPNIAKEMGFDVNRVAKFIKKEKGADVDDEKKTVVSPKTSSNGVTDLLNPDVNSSKLVLLKFPQFFNMAQKMDESESSSRRAASSDPKVPESQVPSLASIKSLPEGYVGKLQILKSGKTRLMIGSVEYVLDSVSSLRKGKHEIASIATDINKGDLCALGPVHDMLKFVPNGNSLCV